MSSLGPRRTRDLAFIQLLREARRAMRFSSERESLTWLGMFAEEIEQAVCVRCLTLEDVLDAIMNARPSGSIIDPLPEFKPPLPSPRPARPRWFRWSERFRRC